MDTGLRHPAYAQINLKTLPAQQNQHKRDQNTQSKNRQTQTGYSQKEYQANALTHTALLPNREAVLGKHNRALLKV